MDRIGVNAAEIEVLYRQHGASLLLFATAIAGERSRAQDLVHQVFLKLIENGNLSRAKDKKAYLFACVRNAVLNERKLEERQAPLDTDAAWFSPPDRDHAGEQNLRRALGTLPDDQKQVVVLHVWGELTFSQIGDLLGVSSNTTASRYRYALGKLRDSMLVRRTPVPTLDDDRFEAYLKTFRPIVPDAMPLIANTQKSWRRLLLRSAVAAAAVVILGVVSFHIVDSRVTENHSNLAAPEVAAPKRPLTMQEAN